MQISSNLHSNVSRSTRINSSSVHTYIFRLFYLRVILQGFVTQNATWCQNRGCICISSTRRTYGRIHMLPVIQTSTIILWTELFPKKRREKISKVLQSIFEYSGVSTFLQELQDPFEYSVFYSVSTRNPATPSNSAYRINSSPRNTTTTRLIPCRSVQGIFQWLLPCLQAFYTAEYSTPSAPYTSRLPVILGGRNSILHGSQHPRSPYSNSQASSTVLHYRILPGEIGFIPKG